MLHPPSRVPALLALALMLTLGLAASAQDPPNIIVIYADDIGYGDFGCYGGTIPTPHVDKLAEQGIRFTSGYCSSATCTPSRFSLLTGRYAFRQQGTGILRGDAPMIIAPGTPTAASILHDAGYTTGVVGKWHLGLGSRENPADWNGEIRPAPIDIGFDYQFLMAATGDRVPCVYIEGRRVVNLDPDDPIRVRYGGQNFPGELDGRADRDQLVMDWSHGHNAAVVNGVGRIGYMTGGAAALWDDETMADEFTEKALGFIERSHADGPFFLFFATHDNHVPRLPHPRFAGVSGQGPRGDSIVQFDWCVGQVVAKLDELGLTENTLILLTSDNGAVLDDGYKDQANELLGDHVPSGPLRGGKYSLFEGGTRVPFIVNWPGTVEPDVSDALVRQVDFCATFAALAGRELAAGVAPDSVDVSAAMLGRSADGRDHIIMHAGALAIRVGDWKYLPPGRTREGLGPWRRADIPEPGALYNLADDPGEQNNLADEHPERLRELRERLESIRAASEPR